jgi:aspartyl-tRNA(Asn)/glutamyl-tRNA(Gln) amidotransferase subunit C
MALTREEVLHIAHLARIGLTEEDVERFRGQLSEILEHFQSLQELDTDDVSPTAYPLPLENVMRDDETRPPLSRQDVLANAPNAEDGALRVRAVLEE